MTLAHPVNLQRAQDEAVGHALRNLMDAVVADGRDISLNVHVSDRLLPRRRSVTLVDWTLGANRRGITEASADLALALDTVRDRLNRDDWKDRS